MRRRLRVIGNDPFAQIGGGRGGISVIGGSILPVIINFSTVAAGALPYPLVGATWAVNGSGQAVNTPTLTQKLSNGNMETGDPPTGWSAITATLDGVADERTGGAGAQSLSVARNGSNTCFSYQTTSPTAIGRWYNFGLWIKNIDATNTLATTLNNSPAVQMASSALTWTQMIKAYRSTTASEQIRLNIVCTGLPDGVSARFDDVSLAEVSNSALFAVVDAKTPSVTVSTAITRTAYTHAGIVMNLDSQSTPANFVVVYLDGTSNVITDKCVAGTYTNIAGASGAVTYGAGRVLKVVKSGTSYSVYYGVAGSETQVGTTQTISDAGIVNNTQHGLFSDYSGNIFTTLSITNP